MRKFYIFISLPLYKKILYLQAVIYFIIFQIMLKFYSLPKILHYIDKKFIAKQKQNQHQNIKKDVIWTIKLAKKYMPWDCKCLVQALVARTLLAKRGQVSVLYLGVKKDKDKDKDNQLYFHAWLKCGEVTITGGKVDNFVEIDHFPLKKIENLYNKVD